MDATRPIGTKGSLIAMAEVIVFVNNLDAPSSASSRIAAPTPREHSIVTISLNSSSPSSSIKVAIYCLFPYYELILQLIVPDSKLQCSVGQTIAIVFETCGSCGYQWAQLDSAPAFLFPVNRRPRYRNCDCAPSFPLTVPFLPPQAS